MPLKKKFAMDLKTLMEKGVLTKNDFRINQLLEGQQSVEQLNQSHFPLLLVKISYKKISNALLAVAWGMNFGGFQKF